LGNKNVAVTGVLSLLTILSAVFVMLLEVKTFALSNVTGSFSITWEAYTSISLATCTDLLIAIALCFYLYRTRRGGYKTTNSILTRLCLYAISTGSLTSLWCIACLTAFVKNPQSFFFLAFYLPQSKLYVNAFLASLNARERLRGKATVAVYPSQNIVGSSSMGFCRPPSDSEITCTESEPPVITIDIEGGSFSTEETIKACLGQSEPKQC